MNAKERQQLKNLYADYFSAYKNDIITYDKLDGIKTVVKSLLDKKEIINIENKINWQDEPKILIRFKFLDEIISSQMQDYIFIYDIFNLDFIKDEFQFFAESEKQYNAICTQIDELINLIKTAGN